MENKGELFVKINYKVKGTGSNLRCDARINYINAAEASKYVIGGGYCNKEACSFVFKASDLEEAKKIVNNNPLLKRWRLKYDNIKWDLTVVPAF